LCEKCKFKFILGACLFKIIFLLNIKIDCIFQFSCKKSTHLQQHEKTDLHQRRIKDRLKQNLINTTNSNNRNDSFNQDLCNAFVAANIPWNKLNSAPLKNFLTKYCNRNIPNESTLRKNYMLPCYNEVRELFANVRLQFNKIILDYKQH
jgi:uncharacterized Zn-finger protein